MPAWAGFLLLWILATIAIEVAIASRHLKEILEIVKERKE